MNQFDTIFEKAFLSLKEKDYVDSTFVDNVRLLIKTLIDNDLLPKNKSVDLISSETMRQPKNVKEIVLNTQDQALPPLKVQVKQASPESETFSVTVIDVRNPSNQKEFTNSMLETVFEDVLQYIKTITLQGLKPEAAVDTLPTSQGANSQPGAEQTALPGAQTSGGNQPQQQPNV